MKLEEARVLLTGATGGIGSALAARLKAEGCQLLAQGRSTRIEATAFVQADLSREEDLERLATAACEFNANVLINNCGINQFSEFERADIARLVDVNVKAPMLLTQRLLPHLKSQPEAVILNVGSTFGQIGFPGYVAYCATKHAIKGFSEALRRELIDSTVHVQYVSPRATRTGMNSAVVNELNTALGTASDDPDYLAARIVEMLKNGRSRLQMGRAENLQVKINSIFPTIVDSALTGQLPTIRDHFLREETIS